MDVTTTALPVGPGTVPADIDVVIYDSGVGGLTVARHLAELHPQANVLYVADNGWFPYGDKSDLALRARIYAVLHTIVETAQPLATVVACNTASTAVAATLDDISDAMPIFTVVPPIGNTVRAVRGGTIALLATPSTTRRQLVRELIARHAGESRVQLVPAMGLVHLAERKLAGGIVTAEEVAHVLDPVLPPGERELIDGVILGCTHFPWLIEELRPAFPSAGVWSDPALDVARHVTDHLVSVGPRSTESVGTRALYLTSGHNRAELRHVFERHGFGAGPSLPFPWHTYAPSLTG